MKWFGSAAESYTDFRRSRKGPTKELADEGVAPAFADPIILRQRTECPMPDNPHKPRVVDNPDVNEIYVNKTIGCSFDGGAISVLLGCSRVVPERLDTMPEQDQPPPVYVTGRLALSPAAAVELINSLNGILAAISNAPNSPISAFPGGGSAKPN
jgi:hypothetical protein